MLHENMSSDGSPDENERKTLFKGKKPGRPPGTEQKRYTWVEMKCAFEFMLKSCPKSASGDKFLTAMGEVS